MICMYYWIIWIIYVILSFCISWKRFDLQTGQVARLFWVQWEMHSWWNEWLHRVVIQGFVFLSKQMQHSLPESVKVSHEIMIVVNEFGGGGAAPCNGTCRDEDVTDATCTEWPAAHIAIQHENIVINAPSIISRMICICSTPIDTSYAANVSNFKGHDTIKK